ncbi:hypothetical protein [Endozoicomonas sp. ONNA2]|uniref:hypothetical protein n=1 Tax=Endozoicomonas sp. ONNA2 TaxID=2828741 RepID=UPI002147BCE0|nr:hypothetical protein [Endozoicomonas sp. ONNA2]
MAKSVLDAGWGTLKDQLKYKAIAQSEPSSVSAGAQRNMPGSFNEPQGACLSQSASGDFSAAQIAQMPTLHEGQIDILPTQGLRQQGTSRRQTDETWALRNNLVKAVNNESWDNAHRIQCIFEGIGARLMDDGKADVRSPAGTE